MNKVYIKVIALSLLLISCLCFAGCKKDPAPQATGSANAVSKVTIDGAISEDVKNKIDFDAYKNQRAYELAEKNSSSEIKLLYPVNIYQTETMDVKYHVDISTTADGSSVLEVLGTDFTVPKHIKEIKVEWVSVGLKVLPTEKFYEFKGLCVTMDGEVCFYEDVFYSPYVEGRKIDSGLGGK